MQELINKIKEYCEKYEGESLSYDEYVIECSDCDSDPYDSWDWGWCNGRRETCNHILEIIKSFNKE